MFDIEVDTKMVVVILYDCEWLIMNIMHLKYQVCMNKVYCIPVLYIYALSELYAILLFFFF